jgi:hypothetical protein
MTDEELVEIREQFLGRGALFASQAAPNAVSKLLDEIDRLKKLLNLEPVEINPNQHCTSDDCPYTQSHTAKWCGRKQTRQCDCHWDYPERGQI